MRFRNGKQALLTLAIGAMAFAFLLSAEPAGAGNKYWVGGSSGLWSAGAKWSTTSGGSGGAGAPAGNDSVYINQSVNTVTYDSTASLPSALTLLQIDASVAPTLSQTGGSLSAATEYVGYSHNRVYNQTGGSVSGPFTNNGSFTYSGGAFNGRLVNNGTAVFNASFTAGDGMENNSDFSIVSGRAVTFNGSGLDNQGTITLTGATLSGNGALVSSGGISGYGTIAGSGGFVNYGELAQTGGKLTLSNTGSNINYGNWDLASGYQFQLSSGVPVPLPPSVLLFCTGLFWFDYSKTMVQ
jgi:hypothetical protein